jgi:hypothetical protein
MNINSGTDKSLPEKKSRFGCLQILGIAFIIVIAAGLITAGWVKYNLYASQFTPTKLSTKEKKILDSKLNVLKESSGSGGSAYLPPEKVRALPLEPEAYSETGAKREISLSEKELNALIANNPEVASKVAIDLSENLVSLKLVVPVDDDIIVFGGKTLRLNMGIILSYENDALVVALKGISMGGIPIPNAWLAYTKNKNLVEEFGGQGGFWDLFSEGVKDLKVRDGHLLISLKE